RKEQNGCRAQYLAQIPTRWLTWGSKQEPEHNRGDGETDDDSSTESVLHMSQQFLRIERMLRVMCVLAGWECFRLCRSLTWSVELLVWIHHYLLLKQAYVRFPSALFSCHETVALQRIH